MKRWRKEKFEEWFSKNNGEDNNKYIVNYDEIKIMSEKELIAEVYHHIDIENDSSVQDYSYYVEKFTTCPHSMVALLNEFREGSGEYVYITDLDNIDLSDLLGHDTDLEYDKMKNMSFEEIQKYQEDEDEDAWVIWDLIELLKDKNCKTT